MNHDQIIGLFISLVCAWWFGYSVGYRCRMHESSGLGYPAWVGCSIICAAMLGVSAVIGIIHLALKGLGFNY